MKYTQFAPHRYRLHIRLLVTQRALPEAHSPHRLADKLTLSRQYTAYRSQGPNFRFHEFTNPLGFNTIQGIHMPERISYTSTPPQHTLKSTASSCSLGQLENECVQEGRGTDLPLQCLHFPINSRFTERFWHLSKYFFALADRPNDYLKTFFLLETLHPTKYTPNTTPFIYNLVFYIPHRWI